jgi:hypothetical protein
MELTRRDALLGAIGGSSAVSLAVYELESGASAATDPASLSEDEVRTLVSVAETVYPSQVDPTGEFVRGYTTRLDDARVRATRRTIGDLDRAARRHFGTEYRNLSTGVGDRLLRRLGVDRVRSGPGGTLAERVRFHLVNSLLYVLMTSPRGTEPFDIENPVGHPGGFESRRNPI